MMKWKKIALITAPLLIGGSVYALAADGSSSQQAAATTPDSAVSYQVVKSEPLSTDEMQALQQAKVAPSADATAQTATVDPMDPFVMYDGKSAPSAAAPAQGAPAPAPAPTNPNEQFRLDSVKNFAWTTMTTQGELKLDFQNEGGKVKLVGQLNGRQIQVEGDKALALLGQLMQNAHLNEALTATMQGKQATLDASVVAAIQNLKIELQDGRKIEANGHGNNQKGQQGQQGQHDNGNHWGQDKKQKDNNKNNKNKESNNDGEQGHDD